MKLLSLCAAFAVLAVAAPPPPALGATLVAAASKSSTSDSKAKARKNSLRQFSGMVTSLDKTSITVEKGGKKPRTMTFARHSEMRTQGDLDKDVRVTIYYRDEDGQPVAHRVVVKTDRRNGTRSGR